MTGLSAIIPPKGLSVPYVYPLTNNLLWCLPNDCLGELSSAASPSVERQQCAVFPRDFVRVPNLQASGKTYSSVRPRL